MTAKSSYLDTGTANRQTAHDGKVAWGEGNARNFTSLSLPAPQILRHPWPVKERYNHKHWERKSKQQMQMKWRFRRCSACLKVERAKKKKEFGFPACVAIRSIRDWEAREFGQRSIRASGDLEHLELPKSKRLYLNYIINKAQGGPKRTSWAWCISPARPPVTASPPSISRTVAKRHLHYFDSVNSSAVQFFRPAHSGGPARGTGSKSESSTRLAVSNKRKGTSENNNTHKKK